MIFLVEVSNSERASERHRGRVGICTVTAHHKLRSSNPLFLVLNIVTGESSVIAKTLAEHQHVDGVWYFGDVEGCYNVQKRAANNMKRTFVCSEERDWMSKEEGEGEEFLREASEVKNIWMPMGESMSGAGAAY